MVGHSSQTTSANSSTTNNTTSPCQPVSSSTMSSAGKVAASTGVNNNNGGGAGVNQNQLTNTHKCVWCRENKRQLNYVLPTQHGKKEFCSEMCLLQFRKVYQPGNCTLCANCDCAIRTQDGTLKINHEGKDINFCARECSEEFKNKHGLTNNPPPPSPQQQQQQKPPLPPATKKKTHVDPNTPFSEDFKWPEYLVKTNMKPAPSHCFKQHLTPPLNEFAKDMKLEAVDPRNTTSTCIATVIGTAGPRVQLRLDGSDNKNDFWRMVDSGEIQPIGTCEQNGGLLQPPLGFSKNASFWPNFLLKTLNGTPMAPAECFKTEPVTPRFNLFKVGHKLEAVDRKNPQLICVATVGDVRKDQIHVMFDGWRGAFDYWCRYDSRDIFPVRWCEMAGLMLQPPGNKVQPHVTPPSTIPSPQQQISNHPSSPTQPQSTLHLNPYCDCGPYLDSHKLKCSPTLIGPSNIQEVYNQFIQILRHCAVRGSPLDELITVQGSDINEQGDFWEEILGLIGRFKVCENLVSDRVEDEEEGGGGNVVRGRGGARIRECSKCGGGGRRVSNGEEGGGVGGGKIVKKRKSSGGSGKVKVEVKEEPAAKKQAVVVKDVKVVVGSGGDPGDWDVEQVIAAIVGVDRSMENYAELFRKHEIDGKAMLLLTNEMMMRYMQLKLGPALKICNIISKFKSKSTIKNGSNGV